VPFLGGSGCDFIRNYPQNNFVEFESGMDPTNPNSTKTASIHVGPGASVAIAGSDCNFGDNFTFHRLMKWSVQPDSPSTAIAPTLSTPVLVALGFVLLLSGALLLRRTSTAG
jgi:hypothetical protein